MCKKKMRAMVLAMIMAASLTSCGEDGTAPADSQTQEESAEQEVQEAEASEKTADTAAEDLQEEESTEETQEGSTEETQEESPYAGLTLYESAEGISIYMAEGYVENVTDEIPDIECFFEGELSNVSFSRETYEELQVVLEQGGYNSVLSEKDYGELNYQVYREQIEGLELLTNEYDDLYMTYELDYDGHGVTYFVYFDQGDKAWWTTNFMCPSEVAGDMEADFHLWASSIQVP